MRALLFVASLGLAIGAHAQGTGLTALMPPPLPLASASSAKQPVAAPERSSAGDKAILNGRQVSLAAFIEEGGVQRVHVEMAAPFAKLQWSESLVAARGVQRDIKLSCRSLCKPVKMPAPSLSAEGKLSFDLLLTGLDRNLTTVDTVALLQAQALAKTPVNKLAAGPASSPALAASPAQ